MKRLLLLASLFFVFILSSCDFILTVPSVTTVTTSSPEDTSTNLITTDLPNVTTTEVKSDSTTTSQMTTMTTANNTTRLTTVTELLIPNVISNLICTTSTLVVETDIAVDRYSLDGGVSWVYIEPTKILEISELIDGTYEFMIGRNDIINETLYTLIVDRVGPQNIGDYLFEEYEVTLSFNENIVSYKLGFDNKEILTNPVKVINLSLDQNGEFSIIVEDEYGNLNTIFFVVNTVDFTVSGQDLFNTTPASFNSSDNRLISAYSFDLGETWVNVEISDHITVKDLTEGYYTIVLKDEYGFLSEPFDFKFDITSPSLISGLIYNNEDNVFEFDELVKSYSIDSGDPIEIEGSVFLQIEFLEEGYHTLDIWDLAGNMTQNIEIIIDLSAPIVFGEYDNESKQYIVEYLDLTDCTYEVFLNNILLNTSSLNFKSDGNYKIIITDSVGNKTEFDFELDYSAPAIVNETVFNSSDILLEFNENIYKYYLDYNEEDPILVDGLTQITFSELREGETVITFFDKSGNMSTDTIIIDLTPPTVSVRNLPSLEVPYFYLYIYDRTETSILSVEKDDDILDQTTNKFYSDGEYRVIVEDLAGWQTIIEFTVDNTKPIILSADISNKDVTVIEINENIIGYSIGEDSWIDTIETKTITIDAIPEGETNIYVKDLYGNIGTYSVNPDYTAPTTDSPSTFNKDYYHIYYSEEIQSYSIDDGLTWIMFDEPVSIIPLNIFDEGSYTIIVADLAGNISEPKSFIFDFTKPTLEVPEFINTSYYQFSFSELILGYSIDDGNAWISLEEPSNTIDLVDLPEGAINIQVVDLAKNYSINYSINIDYTDPTVTLTKMFNDRFYSLSIADNNDYEIVSILKDATPLEIPKVLVFEVSGQYEITVRDSFQNETIFNFEIPNIPTISLVQSQPLILEVNSPIPDLTSYFIANDMKDGEIAITSDMIFTDLTLETIGDYLVTCKVEDSDGNVSSASILISVISQSPVIKISKEADSFLHPNFEAPDFTTYFEAYDAIDGFIDITSDMITTDFISNTPGEYSIECNVTDSDGNMSTASINVIVIDYIFIESITDLDNIRNNPYSAYILANDIEFNDSIWIPFEFFGVFDGNGYTISGINVNITSTDTYAGLFSINHGTVRNVNITNTNINIENWITVYAGVIAGINSGNIYNVNVSGNVTASINSYLHNGNETAVGGIVGKNTGLITNTSFSGSTTAYIPNNMEAYVGGISGQNEYGTLINVSANVNAITRSYFLSHSYVYNPRYIYIGGISGTNKQGTITNASSSGKLDSELFFENKYIGGITGSNGGTINCSESSVTIYSNSYDDTDEYYGGITGYNGGEIRNVLSKVYIRPSLNGLDSGMSYIYVGGIAGRNNGSIDYAISVATLEAKAIFTNYDVDGVHDTRYVGLLVGGNFGFITNSLAEGSIDLVNIYQVFGVNPNVHAGSIYGYKGSTSVIENTYVSEASTFEAYNIYRSNIISSVYFQKLSFYEYLDLDFSIWDISNISLDGIHGLLLN